MCSLAAPCGRSHWTATVYPDSCTSSGLTDYSSSVVITPSMNLMRSICDSCSDEGLTVILLTVGHTGDDFKEHSVDFHEPLTAVCLEPSSVTSPEAVSGKERSFLAGGSSGRLVLHRADSTWFIQKDAVLFDGAGSSISSITRGFSYVAWADASNVSERGDALVHHRWCPLSSNNSINNMPFRCG